MTNLPPANRSEEEKYRRVVCCSCVWANFSKLFFLSFSSIQDEIRQMFPLTIAMIIISALSLELFLNPMWYLNFERVERRINFVMNRRRVWDDARNNVEWDMRRSDVVGVDFIADKQETMSKSSNFIVWTTHSSKKAYNAYLDDLTIASLAAAVRTSVANECRFVVTFDCIVDIPYPRPNSPLEWCIEIDFGKSTQLGCAIESVSHKSSVLQIRLNNLFSKSQHACWDYLKSGLNDVINNSQKAAALLLHTRALAWVIVCYFCFHVITCAHFSDEDTATEWKRDELEMWAREKCKAAPCAQVDLIHVVYSDYRQYRAQTEKRWRHLQFHFRSLSRQIMNMNVLAVLHCAINTCSVYDYFHVNDVDDTGTPSTE